MMWESCMKASGECVGPPGGRNHGESCEGPPARRRVSETTTPVGIADGPSHRHARLERVMEGKCVHDGWMIARHDMAVQQGRRVAGQVCQERLPSPRQAEEYVSAPLPRRKTPRPISRFATLSSRAKNGPEVHIGEDQPSGPAGSLLQAAGKTITGTPRGRGEDCVLFPRVRRNAASRSALREAPRPHAASVTRRASQPSPEKDARQWHPIYTDRPFSQSSPQS